jgi:hypothetical protein
VQNPSYEISAKTPETYLGYARIDHFVSPERIVRGKLVHYSAPTRLGTNEFAYQGDWIVSDEYANPQSGSTLRFNLQAAQVYIVMRSKTGSSRVNVVVDDKAQYFGRDVRDGTVTVSKDSLYNILTIPDASRHILQLEFTDSNVEVFAFTFG